METIDYTSVFKNYSQFQNSNFLDRYISSENLEMYLKQEIFPIYRNEIIGFSELDNPIYSLDLGNGPKKILIWSQMHGNESTTTKSILDFLNYVTQNAKTGFVDNLLNTCQIKIIPMLNPDGSSKYTRFNANEVDLNRDAVQRSQKESRHFFRCLEAFKPHYCFNMHGQRTIFSAGNSNLPASLSFLAPSYDYNLSINDSREKAMKLVVCAHKMLLKLIPGQIGKYNDAHNPNCFGDHIQNMGITTVLFEAGHFSGDYNRNITRKFVTLSLLKMLESIAYDNVNEYKLTDYFKIPDNKETHLDIIIKNVSNSASGYIGIQYNEFLTANRIVFQPCIKTLENLSSFFGHRIIDAHHKPIQINGKPELEKDVFIDELEIGDTIIEVKL